MKWIYLCMLCLCFGCGPVIHEGRIVNKAFYPAHDVEDDISIPCGDTTISVPSTSHIPDKWTVTIEKVMNDKTNEKVRREVYVEKTVYDQNKIGDCISFDD